MSDDEIPKIRIARPVNDFENILKFYRDGLGLEILYQFKNHQGFDGIMLGKKGASYHFEFTKKDGHIAPSSPTQDNLIVFYLPNDHTYQATINRMKENGFNPVSSFNPYWDNNGVTFEDEDGYRIVLYHGTWLI